VSLIVDVIYVIGFKRYDVLEKYGVEVEYRIPEPEHLEPGTGYRINMDGRSHDFKVDNVRVHGGISSGIRFLRSKEDTIYVDIVE
jgi:hypothetical protein